MTFSSRSTPSISDSSCGTIVVSTSERHPGAAGAEQRVHLVEEHHHGRAVGGLLPGPLEDQPDVPLGLADVLVEQLGALDVQEVATCRSACPPWLGDLPGQGRGDRLGDQRLAAAGRAVEQDALRRLQLVLAEQVGVQVRQLDGVADLLDLAAPGRRCPRRRCRGPPPGRAPRPRPWGSARRRSSRGCRACSASPTRIGSPARRLGDPGDALLVGVGDHEHAVVAEDLLELDDLADPLVAAGWHDVERLVEHHLTAGRQLVGLDRRAHRDPHLAPAGEDVDRAVVVRLDDDAVGRRWLGQPVDLGLERDDLLAGLLQRADQTLVLGGHRGQRRLQLENAVLQVAGPRGRVREAAPQGRHLLGQQLVLALHLGTGSIVGERRTCRVGRGSAASCRTWSEPPRGRLTATRLGR